MALLLAGEAGVKHKAWGVSPKVTMSLAHKPAKRATDSA